MATIVIFANLIDRFANNLLLSLKHRQVDVELITDQDLATATSWTHQCSEDGDFHTTIHFRDGRILATNNCSAVYNRLQFLRTPFFFNDIDRQYAEMELYALFISFLKSIEKSFLCPFQTIHINCNFEQYHLYYLQLAATIGLPIADYIRSSKPIRENTKSLIAYHYSSNTNALKKRVTNLSFLKNIPIIYQKKITETEKLFYVLDHPSPLNALIKYQSQLALLAKKLGFPILELTIGKKNNNYQILHINPFPTNVPPDIIDALTQLLISKSENHDTSTWYSNRKSHIVGYGSCGESRNSIPHV